MNLRKLRPSRAQTLNRQLVAIAIGAILAAGGIASSRADTATMSGTFGVAPRYSTITGLCPCTSLRHSVMPTQRGLADMVASIGRWVATPAAASATPQPKRLVSFSASTQGATGWVRDHADEPATRDVEIVAIGSSETPGNGWAGRGHRGEEGLPTDQGAVYDNVTFVVRQYDPIADRAANPNLWSRINEKMSTHVRGYDDIDLDDPDATYVDPVTGSTTKYFRSDVLPMLRWRQRFTSDERMAELDAKYRPRIEAAYDRPVNLEVGPSTPELTKTASTATAGSTSRHAPTENETAPSPSSSDSSSDADDSDGGEE